jgi:hypothetical protein
MSLARRLQRLEAAAPPLPEDLPLWAPPNVPPYTARVQVLERLTRERGSLQAAAAELRAHYGPEVGGWALTELYDWRMHRLHCFDTACPCRVPERQP